MDTHTHTESVTQQIFALTCSPGAVLELSAAWTVWVVLVVVVQWWFLMVCSEDVPCREGKVCSCIPPLPLPLLLPPAFFPSVPAGREWQRLGTPTWKHFPGWCQAHGLPLLCSGAEPQCHRLSQAAVCWSPLADRQGGSCRFPQRSPHRTPSHHISPFTLHTHCLGQIILSCVSRCAVSLSYLACPTAVKKPIGTTGHS